MLRQSRFVLCGLALVFVAAGLASATTYTVTDLGVLAGGTQSYAMAVNDSGTVVGSSRTGAGTTSFRATIYYTGGAWVNIGSTVNNSSGTFATGINNNGQVALWLRSTAEDSYIYQSGTYTDIGAQPGVCHGLLNRPGWDTYQVGNYHGPGTSTAAGKSADGTRHGWQFGWLYLEWQFDEARLPHRRPASAPITSVPSTTTEWWSDGISLASTLLVTASTTMEPRTSFPTGRIPNASPATTSLESIIHPTTPSFTRWAQQRDRHRALSGDTYSIAYGANSSGTVVGDSNDGTNYHSFIYSSGVMTNLSTLVTGTNPFSSLQYRVRR